MAVGDTVGAGGGGDLATGETVVAGGGSLDNVATGETALAQPAHAVDDVATGETVQSGLADPSDEVAIGATLKPGRPDPTSDVDATSDRASRRRPARPATRPPPGELPVVDRDCYQILGEHGRGGLGRILRARDRRTGRIVAIKEMLRGSRDAATRFAREALVTANLQHPAIVPVYEVGRWPSGQPFYAMKLVAGRSLEQAIRGAATPEARTALLGHAIQVADALAYAHDQGWIHRDLKPANILVGDYGETVVIDWGLAKQIDAPPDSADGAATLSAEVAVGNTAVGAVMGTPVYMAPEQARGEPLDARADVYAVGAVLYQILAGVTPYHEARTAADVVAQVTAGPPRSLRALAPDLPGELVAIVERAMAHRSADRYPTARQLSDDLTRFTAGKLVSAHAYSSWDLVRRWLRRYRVAVIVAGVAAAAVLVVGAVALTNVVAARRRAEVERADAVAARQDAEARRRDADGRLVALHTELGRVELARGLPGRALPYLADAYRRAPDDPTLRLLVGQAAEAFAPLELADSMPGGVAWFDDSADSRRLVGFGIAPSSQIWDLERGTVEATVLGAQATLSDDGHRAATADFDQFRIVEVASGDVVARGALVAPDIVRALDFVDQDRALVVISSDGAISWRTPADLAPQRTFQLPSLPTAHAIDPTGAVVAIGLGAGDLWLVPRADARPRRVEKASSGYFKGMEFSDDGATLATSGADHVVRVWDIATATQRIALPHHGLVLALSISGDGSRIITSAVGDEATVWDARTGARLTTVAADGDRQQAVTISPDGRRVATGGGDGSVAIWDATTGHPLAHFVGHDAAIGTLFFTTDERHLVSASVTGDVRVWRAAPTATVHAVDHGERGWHGAYLGDGARLITVGSDKVGRVVDSATGAVSGALVGHTDQVVWVAPSPDGRRVATASRDNTARLWSASGTLQATLTGHTAKVRGVEWNPDGSLVVTTGYDGTARIWRTDDGAVVHTLTSASPLMNAAWSPDGRQIVTVAEGKITTLWDAATGARIVDVPTDGKQGLDARYAPDGSKVVIVDAGMSALVVSAVDGKVRFTCPHSAPVVGAAWSPDGGLLATASVDGTIHLWNGNGSLVRSLRASDRAIIALAFRPDGRILAAGGEDDHVRVWDVTTGRQLTALGVDADVLRLAFRPDGRQLLLAGLDGEIRLWDLMEWTASADELDQRIRCAVPWKLEGEALAPVIPDASACSKPPPP